MLKGKQSWEKSKLDVRYVDWVTNKQGPAHLESMLFLRFISRLLGPEIEKDP